MAYVEGPGPECGHCGKQVFPLDDKTLIWLGDLGSWFEGAPATDGRPTMTFYHPGECFEAERAGIEKAWGPVTIGPSPVDGDGLTVMPEGLAGSALANTTGMKGSLPVEQRRLAVTIDRMLDQAGLIADGTAVGVLSAVLFDVLNPEPEAVPSS